MAARCAALAQRHGRAIAVEQTSDAQFVEMLTAAGRPPRDIIDYLAEITDVHE